jgi:hypothetical protein
MDGCERCMPSWQEGKKWADCDLLDTYSYLCYQMPGGCSAGGDSLCVGSSNIVQSF